MQNMVIRDLFSETRNGAYREIMGAFNLFRVNAVSAQSGITTVDANGNVLNTVNTFLGYRYSGMWNRCWMEPGPNSEATLATTLDNLVPGWTHAFIILNTTSGGGYGAAASSPSRAAAPGRQRPRDGTHDRRSG